MRNDKIRAIVVSGWVENGQAQMIQFNGAFETIEEAYGEAYLFLSSYAKDNDMKKCHISLPVELEGETGFAIFLVDEHGVGTDYTYILFNDFYDDGKEEISDILDRDEPMDVIFSDDQVVRCVPLLECPKCHNMFTGTVSKYCYHCGQALKYENLTKRREGKS